MQITEKSLSNGIRFIHASLPSLESATFTIWYGVGSRYEEKKTAGISHFLEHMAFKGGKKYKTPKAVSEALDAIGADNNASTSQEYTNYYVRAGVSVLPHAVDVLADTLLSPSLPEKEIEKEKGVIVEEINMYEDDPQSCVNNLYGEVIFPKHPLGRDIAGSRESVRSITRNDFLDFRKIYYQPENIVISVSGGIGFKEALALAEKYFGALEKGEYENSFVKFTDNQASPRVALKNKKIEQTNLIVGFPGNKHGSKNRYAEALLSVILSGGMSSRLFREVREKRGLAYAVYASGSHYQDIGEYSAYAGVPVNKALEAVKVILQEFYKIANPTSPSDSIGAKELAKAKEFFKGHMALSMESTKYINYFLGKEVIKGGEVRTPEEIFKKIEAVSVDEIVEVAKKLFVREKANLAVVGPYESEDLFAKILN